MSVLGVSRPGSKGTPSTVITEQIVDAASNKDAIHQAIRLLWAPSVFQICAARATAHAAFALLKAQRRMVQACTLDSLLRGQYFLPDGTAVTIDSKRICEAIQKTKLFNAELERELPLLTDVAPTFFAVMRGDCVDAAVALRKTLGKRTCVLNMANEANPGGGWIGGSGAQEENLCRRSGLAFCLADPFRLVDGSASRDLYPIGEFAVVYSKNVPVFRGSEADGYPYFPSGPLFFGVLTAPAYRHPPTQPDRVTGIDVFDAKWRRKVRSKARAVLRCAAINKERVVVLSAHGCGAFSNPPAEIAAAYKDVANEAEFAGHFDAVVFGILEDKNSGGRNVEPFAVAFSVPILEGPAALEAAVRAAFKLDAAARDGDGAAEVAAAAPAPASEAEASTSID